jgi:PAS domain S-box-containing protein
MVKWPWCDNFMKKIFLKRCFNKILLPVMLCISITGCFNMAVTPEPPRAIDGVLDLTRWNFHDDGLVDLAGEWDFYWNEFINPHEFLMKNRAKVKNLVTVPGKWNNYLLQGEKLSGYGYATYHLKILLPDGQGKSSDVPRALALKIPIINTACSLFINGTELYKAGVPGIEKNLSTPGHLPGIVGFIPTGKDIDLVLHVSNYHYRIGGVWLSIKIGDEREVREARERIIAFTLFLFGSIFIMALYHLGLYLVRRKDASPLYFGLFCLFIAVFTFSMGERYVLKMIPGMNWYHINRMQFLSHYASLPFILLFIHSLYPAEFSMKILRVLITVCGLFVALVIVTPATVYSTSLRIFHVITVIGCIQIFYVLIRAFNKGRHGAGVFLAGFIFLFTAIIIDIIASFGVIFFSIDMVPFGLFIFIFSQAYLLSHRFTLSLNSEENLSNELQQKNLQLDKDIEERKKVEKELLSTKNFMKTILDSLSSMLITVDNYGSIMHWNSIAEKITGIAEADALSKKIWHIIPFLLHHESDLREMILSKKPHNLYIKNSDAEKVTMYTLLVSPFIFSGLDGAVIRIDDVTESMKKDEQLRQAQKMESVGTLAGGLAHDFNNILGGISGAISLLKIHFGRMHIDSDEVSELFEIIKTASVRARDMVLQLLTLSRKYEFSFTSVDINDTVRHVVRICRNTFDKSIEIKMHQYDGRAMVKADPVLLEQVVLNLCINASHAMTIMREEGDIYGGTLTISIDRIYADLRFRDAHPESREGEYWVITHRDTGVGIDQKLLTKIFDPFFTTKKKEKGSGLGLSMAYNIIQQHEGFIDVYSEPGVGSSFVILLPVLESQCGEVSVTLNSEVVVEGSGLILIIDDEEIMRKTGAGILMECGYEVITASDGIEGLQMFIEKKGEIKAVLLDMIMPKMSGREAFVEIKKISPRVSVIISSGFRMDERVNEILEMGANGFIQKPYSIVELSKIIAQACRI